mmetsp:Transcript_7291/g.9282  ORF Transcript_7291/g.9282 Transcript_7291/m.9282 type:complete len:321 (+) Transcript_7291:1118-2080(+)
MTTRTKTRHYKSKVKDLQITCAIENHQIVKDGSYTTNDWVEVDIQQELQQAIDNSVHYHYNHVFPSKRSAKQEGYNTKFSLVNCGSIQAAIDVHHTFEPNASEATTSNNHIGILNFASAKNPGGGYKRGSSAQEENLCRSSLLYPCLAQYEDRRNHYYQINRNKQNQFGTFYSNCAIFSPFVPIIRDDGPNMSLSPNKVLCSFVTSPAPNKSALKQRQKKSCAEKKSSQDDQKLQKVMEERILRILTIFEMNGCTDLILGAFGCGVFGNDPEFVAAAFRKIINKSFRGVFRSITFAILTPSRLASPMECSNYSAFANEFC